jgi:N-acetylated-alpha-linked acidic dipeptidase
MKTRVQRLKPFVASVVVCALFAPHLSDAQTTVAIRGFTQDAAIAERAAEKIATSEPSEAAATRHEAALASYVHRMGSPGDYRTAAYARDAFTRAGWDAKLVVYDVPLAIPYEQSLTVLPVAGQRGATPQSIDLYEATIPSDPFSRDHAAIGIPYSGYSNDGDVTGPLVYANYATAADFDDLAKANVDVRGAIVIARAGKGSLTGKAFESAKHGAKATLVFRDPMDDGYFKGDVYPKGPWRPTSAAVRNTMTFTNNPGDPTAIGIPVPGAPHKPFSAIVLPAIPESPITAAVAEQLLARMGGTSVPSSWHPGFGRAIRYGGDVRAHFVLRSKRSIGPMWDVIATLKGSDPSQTVVAGGHRDAWTYGAVDPISGTVDLIQMAEALGKAKRAGWTPKRTIVIGSWDGEELNLFGSAIWVDQHDAELRANCVAYLNTDEVAFGPTFGAAATPDLAGLMHDAALDATAPDGTSLDAYWKKSDPQQTVGDIGSGSDHEAFVFREGLPGAQASFYGPFGTYHSAYDDVASLAIYDPGMHRAAAIARYDTLVVMRLADAAIPDVRESGIAARFSARLAEFAKVDTTPRRAAVVAALTPAIARFTKRGAALDADVDAAVASGDTARIARAYAAIRATNAAFMVPEGIDAHGWARSLLSGANTLPTLDDTLDDKTGDAARDALLAAFERTEPYFERPFVEGPPHR